MKLTFVDCSGKKTVVEVASTVVRSLIQVKDFVLNTTKYFENEISANSFRSGAPSNKRQMIISTNLRVSKKETNISTEEFKILNNE